VLYLYIALYSICIGIGLEGVHDNALG